MRSLEVVVRNRVAEFIFEALFLLADLLQEFNVEPVGYLDVTLVTLFQVDGEP